MRLALLLGVFAIGVLACGPGSSGSWKMGTGGTHVAMSTGGVEGAAGAAGGGGGGLGGLGGAGGTQVPLGFFSFFVTSIGSLQTLSGSPDGFGGDLRFGETGPGAGLRGADKICTAIAEISMPGSGAKGWRAFLSAPNGGTDDGPVHARDRIGNGPWYDRMGRLVSENLTSLMEFRPGGADPVIQDDLPNEFGMPNHSDGAPGCTGNACPDNHDTLTGSGADGTLYTETPNPTCSGWTTGEGAAGKPRVGHSWPRPGAVPIGGRSGGLAGYGHWVSSLDEAGCAPGVNLIEMGPPDPSNPTVGSGGGYGGIYCFALTP